MKKDKKVLTNSLLILFRNEQLTKKYRVNK